MQKDITQDQPDETPNDGGRYERTAAWMQAGRENTDRWRLRSGLRAARMDRAYGAGVIDNLARDSGIGRTTLYERAAVVQFLVSWRGLAARRIFDDYPMLTYTHLREAQRLEYEEAIELLLEANDQGWTPGETQIKIAEIQGKPVNPKPIFDKSGQGAQVIGFLWGRRQKYMNKKIRITITEYR